MAKKKKSSRTRKGSRKKAPERPQHTLPEGFWAQVGAVLLIALSLLLVVAWFGTGGPVIEWLHSSATALIGYSAYLLPVLLVYVGVGIFRAEDNRLPLAVRFAAVFLLLWVSGLFGLMHNSQGELVGGFMGELLNSGMLSLVDTGVAAFIYILLISITVIFVLSLNPATVLDLMKGLVSIRSDSEDKANAKVMKKAAKEAAVAEPVEDKKRGKLKLNAGVPMVDAKATEKKPAIGKMVKTGGHDKAAEERQALVAISDPNWKAPGLDLLESKENPADAGDVEHNAEIIQDTLAEFAIDVEMEGANIGPKVTQYTLKPPSGVKLRKITSLETNIALNLAAQSLRIEAPIPGQRAVGIEVPNRKAADVRLRSALESSQWKRSQEPLTFAIGKDIAGEAVVDALNKMPHMLIAGQTGSGKSVMINTLLTSLLYRNSPSDMKLILVDPKQVEMAPYADIPHLLTPVITEPEKTISALKWAVNEMERRYKLLAEEHLRDIKSYNQKQRSRGTKIAVHDESGKSLTDTEEGAMPYIVIVIDELADMMMIAKRDVETLVVRLAQKARAVGIHLVLATQRPSVDVITGLIKANVPARIAFTVASQVDSMTILGSAGAEKLLGQGDMLIMTTSMHKPKRIQGAFVSDDEVIKITDHLRMQSAPQYNDEIISQPVQLNGKGGVVMDFDSDSEDDMYNDAVKVVVEGRRASTSLLQRRLRIGYARAARIMEEMEENGIIGPQDGSRPREVLVGSMAEIEGGADE